MGVLAGRDCAVYVGNPTAVTLTDEPCTDVGGTHTTFQITNAAKRALDPATAVVVEIDGSPVAGGDANYVLDHAHGRVTFTTPLDVGDDVTLSGKYIALHQVALAKKAKVLAPQAVMADVTRLGDTSERAVKVASKCEVTLDHMHQTSDDLDTSGESLTFATALGTVPLFLEVQFSTVKSLRGWFVASGDSFDHSLAEAMSGSLTLKGVVQTTAGGRAEQALFSIA